MSQLMDLRMDELREREIVREIALKEGLIKWCEFHEYYFDLSDNATFVDMDALAKTLISRNEPSVKLFDGNWQELADILREVCTDIADHCPGCDAWDKD